MNEQIKKYIDDYIKTESRIEGILYVALTILLVILCFWILNAFKYNNDVKERNKKLEFCDSIYKSDGVILEQCKDYFIIYE